MREAYGHKIPLSQLLRALAKSYAGLLYLWPLVARLSSNFRPERYAEMVSDSLFEMDMPKTQGPLQHMPITDDQVAQIRAAFADAGIDDQAERKALVESCLVRPVSSIRELYASEAHRVLGLIRKRKDARPKILGGSAWDNREEDTWLDRL